MEKFPPEPIIEDFNMVHCVECHMVLPEHMATCSKLIADIQPADVSSPLSCRMKGCDRIGTWKPVLLIPRDSGVLARMLLDMRICTGCKEAGKVALKAHAIKQQDRLKKAFSLAGRPEPENLENIDVTYVRVDSTEARRAAKMRARGFSV